MNADLDSEKYADPKQEEDDEQQVCRLYRKQMDQLVKNPLLEQETALAPVGLDDLFSSSNGLEDGVNFNLENDAHAIIDQLVNQDNAKVTEVSVRLRPYIKPAQGTDYFGKDKVMGSNLKQ